MNTTFQSRWRNEKQTTQEKEKQRGHNTTSYIIIEVYSYQNEDDIRTSRTYDKSPLFFIKGTSYNNEKSVCTGESKGGIFE